MTSVDQNISLVEQISGYVLHEQSYARRKLYRWLFMILTLLSVELIAL
jgi:hypothetical protein